jgi:diguanylate cyclase (GGDEF)-like protein
MLGAGLHPPALRVLAAYLVLFAMADTGLSVATLSGRPTLGWTLAEVLVTCASIALGVAGLHPSMRQVEDRSPTPDPDAGWRRLLLLTITSLIAPATLFVQHYRGAPLNVPLVCGACAVLYLLVLARMAGLVAAQREVAITDGLTGLHTRRYFEHSLAVEGERALRGSGLAVLLLDIDHFKAINDTYGHHGGDRVLCEVARRLRTVLRGGELVARYGGEEFAVLVEGLAEDDAIRLVQRLLQEFCLLEHRAPEGGTFSVSFSAGVALLDTPELEGWLERADAALLAAKRGGRRQVLAGSALPAADRP